MVSLSSANRWSLPGSFAVALGISLAFYYKSVVRNEFFGYPEVSKLLESIKPPILHIVGMASYSVCRDWRPLPGAHSVPLFECGQCIASFSAVTTDLFGIVSSEARSGFALTHYLGASLSHAHLCCRCLDFHYLE